MNVEMIGEKNYLEEIINNESLWVAMKSNTVYSQNSEEGLILFTWSTSVKAKAYIEQSKMENLNAVEVPLNVVLTSWLGGSMSISQVSANASVGSKMLVFSSEELHAKLSKNT